MVALEPTFQKTLQAEAPLVRMTLELTAVTKVVAMLKTNTPGPDKVREPVISNVPERELYVPLVCVVPPSSVPITVVPASTATDADRTDDKEALLGLHVFGADDDNEHVVITLFAACVMVPVRA